MARSRGSKGRYKKLKNAVPEPEQAPQLGEPDAENPMGHGTAQDGMNLFSRADENEALEEDANTSGREPLPGYERSGPREQGENGIELAELSELADLADPERRSVDSLDFDLEDPEASNRASKLSFAHGFALVVGLQIGSGIFASPQQILDRAGSYGAALVIWLVSGIVAACGASCYSELGSALPVNGGTQAYLAYIYGPLPSFVYSFVSINMVKPGGAAITALVFGEYVCRLLAVDNQIFMRALSGALVCLVTVVNCFGNRVGSRVGKAFLVLKLALVAMIVTVGFFSFVSNSEAPLRTTGFWEGTDVMKLPLALYGGLWAYDGWDNLNFISAEMRNPTKHIPRILKLAMHTVIIAYVLTNLAYFAVLTPTEIHQSSSVSLTMMQVFSRNYPEVRVVFGSIVAVGVALSCAGALNATALSGAKLVQASSKEFMYPGELFLIEWRRFNAPVPALFFQCVMTCILVGLGEFKVLVELYGASIIIFYIMTVAGLVVLRKREPELHRPYKASLLAVAVFLTISVTLVMATAYQSPWSMFYLVIATATVSTIYIVLTRAREKLLAMKAAHGTAIPRYLYWVR